MVAGNMYPQKIACANSGNAAQDFSAIVGTEALYKITPTQNVYVLFTPSTSVVAADNSDYLIPANTEREFALGRGLSRIAIRNESGSAADVHVAILF